MNTKIISKGMDLPKNDLDEFYEFLDEGECVPMSIPILKKRVQIPIEDDLAPQGVSVISIDEWIPLGSLQMFKNFKWLPIGDKEANEEDWIPFEDLIDIHDYDQEDDDLSFA